MRLTRGPRRRLQPIDRLTPMPGETRVWATFRAFKAGITGDKGEERVATALAALGVPALHDVILRDRLGLTQIDHIVRASDAIVVLETKNYSGHIGGGVNDAAWVQRFDGTAETFELPNPRLQNFRYLQAVDGLVADRAVLVRACVVAVGTALFDAGLHDAVVPLADLAQHVLGTTDPPQRWLDAAWCKLEAAAAASPALRPAHRAQVEARRKPARAIGAAE